MSYDDKCLQVRCDHCGKFISFESLMDGTALHVMRTPDSHYSSEEYESLCKKCFYPK